MSGDLTGKSIRSTYKDLLQVSNDNNGVDDTVRDVCDGEGTVSALQVSKSTVNVEGTFTVNGLPVGGGSGEVNTSSNLGGGEGLASTKVGVDLPFKSLVGGDNVTLASDSNEVTINASGGFSSMNQGVFKNAYFISSLVPEVNTLTTATHTGGHLKFMPFTFSHEYTYDRVGVSMPTSGGGSIRFGLFTMDFDTELMTLITDFGTVSASGTGVKEVSINETIPAGNYFIGIVSDSNISITSLNDPVNASSLYGTRGGTALTLATIRLSGEGGAIAGGFDATYAVDVNDTQSGDPANIFIRRPA